MDKVTVEWKLKGGREYSRETSEEGTCLGDIRDPGSLEPHGQWSMGQVLRAAAPGSPCGRLPGDQGEQKQWGAETATQGAAAAIVRAEVGTVDQEEPGWTHP